MSVFHGLPRIKRGRSFHCQGVDGTRYLDLHRAGGGALLGYNVPGLGKALKALVDVHAWTGMPDLEFGRARRMLGLHFPDHDALPVASWHEAGSVCARLGLPGLPFSRIDQDSVFGTHELSLGKRKVSCRAWLPFLPLDTDLALGLLPALGSMSPLVLLVRKGLFPGLTLGSRGAEELLQMESGMSPLQSKALQVVIPLLEGLGGLPDLGRALTASRRTHEDNLGLWRESWWARIAQGPWDRHGPCLGHSLGAEDWRLTRDFALRQGILLPPCHRDLVFLPGMCTTSETKALKALADFMEAL